MRILTQLYDSPYLWVAPHGFHSDDANTDIVTRMAADRLSSSFFINVGWRRGESIDESHRQADLNNLRHCIGSGAVRSEFTAPLFHHVDRLLASHNKVFVFYIHGMANRSPNGERADVVLGYGRGDPDRLTCDPMFASKAAFALMGGGYNVFLARPKGKFSAWRDTNLTQMFRRLRMADKVSSLQIELAWDLRCSPGIASTTGLQLADCLWSATNARVAIPPSGFFFREI